MNQEVIVMNQSMNEVMGRGLGTGSGTNAKLGAGNEIEQGLRGGFMNKENMESGTGVRKKRGPKKKEINEEVQTSKEQNKFFIDVSKDIESKEMILALLAQANNKNYGREIILKDLVLAALPKLKANDLEKIQETSLTEMEKVERALDEYNRKSEVKLSMGEFLVKKLGIN